MSRLQICKNLFQKQTSALKKKRSNFCRIGSQQSLNLEKKGLSQKQVARKTRELNYERSEKKKFHLSADIFRPPYTFLVLAWKVSKINLFSFCVTVDLACMFFVCGIYFFNVYKAVTDLFVLLRQFIMFKCSVLGFLFLF